MRFIDANIFVYHMAQDPRYSERATEIIKRIERGKGCYIDIGCSTGL